MSSKSNVTSESLLDELQATLAHGTVARRVETLRRVTDLFIDGAVDFSDEQIGLFDDVFKCLIQHIEASAKALLANRLAPLDTAPPLTIRALAFDDLIEVAAPVLSRSERLDDEALIETARNKSQAHLMAISTRRVLSGAVTDVLVLRGNDEVIQSTVNNPGAEFTERGFTRLVNRAEGDDNLATCIGTAADDSAAPLPETNREGLGDGAGAARGRQPAAVGDVPSGVTEATRRARSAPSGDHAGNSHRPCAGQIIVSRTAGSTSIRWRRLPRPASSTKPMRRSQRSPMCRLSVAENMMIETRAEGVHDPGKGLGDVMVDGESDHQHARRSLGHGAARSARPARRTYERLRPSTAQQVLRFHRMQQTAAPAM